MYFFADPSGKFKFKISLAPYKYLWLSELRICNSVKDMPVKKLSLNIKMIVRKSTQIKYSNNST